jgi:tetratricopeptide (TPR) repeat protein
MQGKRLGPFRIDAELGSGGMGTVYDARVEETILDLVPGARVALKVIHRHLMGRPGYLERFVREAVVGLRVDHVNVVRALGTLELETDGETLHGIVMEYVEGQTLRELLDRLALVPEALLREIARQIADGLAAIHAAGVVHRDLKPENILITEEHQVRIMDMGVARLVDADTLTAHGEFIGSLFYGAPELFRREELGPPLDLYSLGVLLYELATGVNPFHGTDVTEIIAAHLNLTPPPVATTESEISVFLSEVITTLIEKRQDARFASAVQLRDVLEEGERSAWWVLRERELLRAEKLRPRIHVRRKTDICGREREIEVLLRHWARARTGEGRVLLIEGEAGLGKTRLVDAFLDRIEERDTQMLYGSYPPTGGLGALSDAIVEKFGMGGLEEGLRPYLTVTPDLVASFAAFARNEIPPEGAEPCAGDGVRALFCHLVRGLAAEGPVIWVVDDLHFAEEDSRNIVLSIARAVEDLPVLLLVTTRPGLPEEEIGHYGRMSHAHHILLPRLGETEVIDLIRGVFQSDALAESLGQRIARKSDGVPFFVFEMIRSLEEEGIIRELPSGQCVETRVVEEIIVPSAVRDLVRARLHDLSDGDRGLLDVAAVIGFAFDPDLIARVRGVRRIEVLESLAALERRSGVIRSGPGTYRFDHSQIQEVLLLDLPAALEAEYHAALAEALAARDDVVGADPADVPAETAHGIARHHLKGCRPEEGLPYLTCALDHLTRAFRNDAALRLADDALDREGLLEGTTRAEVLLRKASLLNLLGRREEESACLEEALRLADESMESGIRARARVSLGAHLWSTTRYDEGRQCLESAVLLASAAGDHREETRAWVTLGNILLSQGQHAQARAHHERALALARSAGDRRSELIATGNLGIVYRNEGRLDEARDLYERALDIAQQIRDRRAEGVATGNLGNVMWHLGRYEGAAARFGAYLGISREIGFRLGEGLALLNLGPLWAALGDPDAAQEVFRQARPILREIGARREMGYVLQGLAEVAEQTGDAAQARQWYDEALELRRDIGYVRGVTETLVTRGRLSVDEGLPEEARRDLDEALALSRKVMDVNGTVLATAYLALLAGKSGATEKAEAVDALTRHRSGLSHAKKMEACFVLWRALGDHDHLEDAARLLTDLRHRAPRASRDAMIENVPLHRDIVAAGAAS